MIEQERLDYYIQKIFDHISSNKKIVNEETYKKYKNQSKNIDLTQIFYKISFKSLKKLILHVDFVKIRYPSKSYR